MTDPSGGVYKASPPTLTDGAEAVLLLDSSGNLRTSSGSGTAGSPSGPVQTTQRPDDGAAWTKVSVSMTGASTTLVATSTTRLLVCVSNTDTNAVAAIDPTGGTAALDAGIPLLGGQTVIITGLQAQHAMTCIGTNTQKLTVYTGA